MNLRVALIPFGRLTYVIPEMIPYLEKSQRWSKGRSSVDDIVGFIYSNRMQLWAIYEEETNKIYGYVISEIKQYPQCKMFVVQYCAAEPQCMKLVDDEMFFILESAARSTDCVGIEFFGRPGWEPHVKKRGYTSKTVVYEKYFDEVNHG
jgi:hypothetical protein